MAKEIVTITLRLPSDKLHKEVIDLAKRSNRSLNGEIVHRLEIATQQHSSDSPVEAFHSLSRQQQEALIDVFNALQHKGMI